MNKGGITNWCKGIFNQLCTLRGGGNPKKPHSLSKIAKWSFLTLGFFGVKLKKCYYLFNFVFEIKR